MKKPLLAMSVLALYGCLHAASLNTDPTPVTEHAIIFGRPTAVCNADRIWPAQRQFHTQTDLGMTFTLFRIDTVTFGPQDSLRWTVDGMDAALLDTAAIRLERRDSTAAAWLTLEPRSVQALGAGPHIVAVHANLVDTTCEVQWRVYLGTPVLSQAMVTVRVTAINSGVPTTALGGLKVLSTAPIDTGLFAALPFPVDSTIATDSLVCWQWPFYRPIPDTLDGDTAAFFVAQICLSDTVCGWNVSYYPQSYFLDTRVVPYSFDSAFRWFSESSGLPDSRLGNVFFSSGQFRSHTNRAYADETYWYFRTFDGYDNCIDFTCYAYRTVVYRVSAEGEVVVDSCMTTGASYYPCLPPGTVLRARSSVIPAVLSRRGGTRALPPVSFDLRGRLVWRTAAGVSVDRTPDGTALHLKVRSLVPGGH